MIFKYLLIFSSSLIIELGAIINDNSGLSMEATDKNFSESQNFENILCRGCGSDVSSANLFISKLSPSSDYVFDDTLFNKEEVLVQIISHNIIFQFPIITVSQSACQGFGEWQDDDSWFPGYQWRLCICPKCGAFLGWVFDSTTDHNGHSPDEFFGLVLTSLIGESCNYILHQVALGESCDCFLKKGFMSGPSEVINHCFLLYVSFMFCGDCSVSLLGEANHFRELFLFVPMVVNFLFFFTTSLNHAKRGVEIYFGIHDNRFCFKNETKFSKQPHTLYCTLTECRKTAL